jgi:hypothetical protein
VKSVVVNVQHVLEQQMVVIFVKQQEMIIHQLVIAQITGITLPTLVNNVLTNVNNVPLLNLIVVLVPLTELTLQLVLVQPEPMIFRVIQFVNLVLHNVLPVPTMTNVHHHVLETD